MTAGPASSGGGTARYDTIVVGAHPGSGVTGAPDHNAAHQVLRDLDRGRP